jgi:transposase
MPGRKEIAVEQSIPPQLPYSMQDFNREFPNDDACLIYIFEQRWPGGIARCEKCEKETKHHRVTGRTAFACDRCGWHIYPLAGTIFEKSSTSLQKWFHAMCQMGSTRCGISAKQIQRETSVTYKTAWRMFKQIRSLMSEDGLQLEGPSVEMDETYYGGVRKGGKGRPMRGDRGKTPIVGIVERKGRATQDATGATLLPLVRDYILPESTVYTDEWKPYGGIENIKKPDGTSAVLVHRRINHTAHV